VRHAFESRGIKVDVLLLSPRLSEAAVMRRQIMEGVAAVSRLGRLNQQMTKIPLQVFDRKSGADIRFEEYADLDPSVAAEVVLRARANNAAPAYGYGYGSGYSNIQQSPTAVPSNVQSMIGSMDPNGLQKLLGVMQQTPMTSQPGQLPTTLPPDLSKLLTGAGPYGQQSPYGQAPPIQNNLATMGSNPALAAFVASSRGHQNQQSTPTQAVGLASPAQSGQPDMADILARLGSYRR